MQGAAREFLGGQVVGCIPAALAGHALLKHGDRADGLVDPPAGPLDQGAGGHYPQEVRRRLVDARSEPVQRHLGLEHLGRAHQHDALAGVLRGQPLHDGAGVGGAAGAVLAVLVGARVGGDEGVFVGPFIDRHIGVWLEPTGVGLQHRLVAVGHVAHGAAGSGAAIVLDQVCSRVRCSRSIAAAHSSGVVITATVAPRRLEQLARPSRSARAAS